MVSKNLIVTKPKRNDRTYTDTSIQFIRTANQYVSAITVAWEDHQVNGKSLMGILTANLERGMALTITADGTDEQEALAVLAKLLA